MTKTPAAQTLASRFDVGLFDLDGVTYTGKNAVPHAAEGIRTALANGMRVAYVTNNASRTSEQVAEQLVSLGMPARPEEVVSSAHVAVGLAQERLARGARVMIMGGPGLRDAVAKADYFTVVQSADDHPEAVIQGFFPEVNWEALSEVALAIADGAMYIATNLDKSIPRERGIMVGNGSLVLAVCNTTGAVPLSAGKPEPEIYRMAARFKNAENPLFIGDNLDTDVKGAVTAGIPCLHVLTGLASARDIVLVEPARRPTYLCDDLRGLNEPYPEHSRDDDGWHVVGDRRARWTGTTFELGGCQLTDPLDLNTYRALAAAAWEAADAGTDAQVLADAVPELTVSREV
ncbi:MAG: HAD-IIA family hydrolase [Actinomycetaceae bacterium]|nr:HAD-IIA family hydrolase [Actinomycetaceae bacterium]